MLLREPWPHLVLDDFLTRSEFEIVTTAFSRTRDFIVERREHSTIEYCSCSDPYVYKAFYSINLINIIDTLFTTRARIIPTQGIQFRRVRPETGRFPVHSDYTGEPCSFVCMLYINSAPTSSGTGGELELYDAKNLLEVRKTLEPKPNRLVVFEAAPPHCHAVAAVSGWTRYMMLMELQRSEVSFKAS